MFDRKSDYALNKKDPDAIVFKTAAGAYIRLHREDFSSAGEFLKWKDWSDEDYRVVDIRNNCYHVVFQLHFLIPLFLSLYHIGVAGDSLSTRPNRYEFAAIMEKLDRMFADIRKEEDALKALERNPGSSQKTT